MDHDLNSGGGACDSGECAACASVNVETIFEEREISFGSGEAAVKILAVVPVRHCRDCDFRFEDFAAEDAEHDAICRHLRVLTPGQITALREMHGFSRAEFTKLTRLGEATLSRWERGAVIQNGAYDNFLFLLGFPDNLDRLRRRQQRPAQGCLASYDEQPVFRHLRPNAALCASASDFQLRRPPGYDQGSC